jgi:hypothetical protein
MTTNFQFAQAPNRKGNIGKMEASHFKGVTAVVGPAHGVSTPKGNQGTPSYSRATDKHDSGVTSGRKQKVMVDYKGCVDSKPSNYGYMNSDRNNFLK